MGSAGEKLRNTDIPSASSSKKLEEKVGRPHKSSGA